MSTGVAPEGSRGSPRHIPGVFPGASDRVREIVAERVAARSPNMVLASTYVPPDGVVAAYLLHRLLSSGDTTGVAWHSVFVNSGVEALGTVTKYLRNRHNRRAAAGHCRILVLDPTGTAYHAFGHSVPGLRALVADGMRIVDSAEEFSGLLATGWDSYVVVLDGLSADAAAALRATLAAERAKGRPVAWGLLGAEDALSRWRAAATCADLAFLGEVCVGNEMPCGTVSFTRDMFALWNNTMDSIAHVSTFGGNGLAMRMLCDTVLGWRPIGRRERAAIERMRHSDATRSARLRMHANTWQTRAIDLAAINVTFDRAEGVTYRRGTRAYTDLASGTGPAFRGHNVQSVEMIRTAGTGDETSRLESELARLTGLPFLLPAVSGQSAVDNAVLTALCCRPGRTAVLTLRGNYSGKGPLSLALSRTSSFFRDRDRNAFSPYPVDVLEVDPADIAALRQALRRDDLALVWLELVQGYDCLEISPGVLDEIERHRASAGFLVGVDEIFSGFWRCDIDHFLTCTGRGFRPDLVALSKALSDALIPIGATLLSAAVFEQLSQAAPDTAQWLRTHYRNDLAAGLARAAIVAAEPDRHRAAQVAAAMEEMLRRAARAPLFAGYRRVGLLGRLVLSPRAIGARPRPSVQNYAEAVIARLIMRRCGAITLQMRIAPSTAGADADELIAAMSRVGEFLERLPRWTVDRTTLAAAAGTIGREIAAGIARMREGYGDRKARSPG
ncbi:aminotransferase class III-fold pyridoxal phosphate-dependent enzyme [Nocardia brasiliensis]|uniref:aminotransferase class III-fold pyridoxal phosphate-dependent enzyme n=1 Tax=Nocardia brasiliensis TaxID=37326 RepID=UPI002455FF5F|nr:aminotransferase class III-fold pyridoxal phosphate-dependent enzyme [Nocardia brasiliensis]